MYNFIFDASFVFGRKRKTCFRSVFNFQALIKTGIVYCVESSVLCLVLLLFVADFGVSAKNVFEKQKRDSFIGTPYW